MQSLENFKTKALSQKEMDAIKGGCWSKWKKETDKVTGNCVMQRYTWFGLKGTGEIKKDE